MNTFTKGTTPTENNKSLKDTVLALPTQAIEILTFISSCFISSNFVINPESKTDISEAIITHSSDAKSPFDTEAINLLIEKKLVSVVKVVDKNTTVVSMNDDVYHILCGLNYTW